MTEKSELDEFKAWLLKKQYGFRDNENYNIPHLRVYYEYNAEQKLKEMEKEIKDCISKVTSRTDFVCTFVDCEKTTVAKINNLDEYIDELYDELKEKGYLK